MPEEINRVLTDHISRWLFCPTPAALENLRHEGIESSATVDVALVGDVMYDAWLTYSSTARGNAAIAALIDRLDHFYLATVHREENTAGEEGARRLSDIVSTLERIAETVPVVMLVHPRIRTAMVSYSPKQIQILEPVGYFDMMALLTRCKAVITDSGGLQKEAYFAGKPCITLRDETEWVELVARRCSVLAGADPWRIMEAERQVRQGEFTFTEEHLYGHGDAASQIVKMIATARS
jgi:UDP-GlcNAc3NAcA epimerase